jgi:hypothetical protein
MLCVDQTAPVTGTTDTDPVRRFWPVTEFLSTREAVLAAIRLFANLHRFEGTGVSVRFAWRATNDLNNPGSFTLVGNNLTALGEDVQDVDITTGAANKLFFQLAISAISTTPGQVELTSWQQS